MEDNHQCEPMALAEVWIEKGEQGWLLNINKTATEQDLEENHYLEEVGQTIYQVAVNISFCPYCGSKLGGSDDSTIPSFELYDFSGRS
jgi:hypothetical protein